MQTGRYVHWVHSNSLSLFNFVCAVHCTQVYTLNPILFQQFLKVKSLFSYFILTLTRKGSRFLMQDSRSMIFSVHDPATLHKKFGRRLLRKYTGQTRLKIMLEKLYLQCTLLPPECEFPSPFFSLVLIQQSKGAY